MLWRKIEVFMDVITYHESGLYDLKPNVISFIPYEENIDFNNEKKVAYTESTIPIKKLFAENNIISELAFSNFKDCVFSENHSIEWFGPTIFFPLMVISQNPQVVSFCINIISNYVYDLFKGRSKDPEIKCNFIYEEKNGKKKIHYNGPVTGLKEIKDIIIGEK